MQRYFVQEKNGNQLFLENDDIHHIRNVMRNKIGDLIECIHNKELYICKIEDTSSNKVLIVEKKEDNNELNLDITIAIALVKEQKMDLILQKLTEVGVDEIILVQTKRTVVKVDDKKEDKKLERWERIIYEAAKQSKRGKVPTLRGVLTFKEALADMKENDFNIAPYENEKTKSIKQAIKGVNINNIGIFVGPEGGFEETEIEAIEDIGGQSVSLGPRILRTETASLVASSIVLYELSDLGGDE